jgi:hypothetical protein
VDAFALGPEDAEELHCVLVGGEDEVLVAQDHAQAAREDVQPVVALV